MKKILMATLGVVACFCVAGVYLIGGQVGVYSWNIAVFILAPIAVISLIVQLIVMIILLIRKKKIGYNLGFIAISTVYALPITVLMGISPLTYPTNASPEDAITASLPVEDALLFGGKEYKSHAMWPSECYAFDVLKEPYGEFYLYKSR